MKAFLIPVIASILILGSFGFTQQSFAAPVFVGPTPYLSTADIPVGFYAGGSPTFLEDFEDGTLDGGIIASDGLTTSSIAPTFVDSVDADDGSIDGLGSAGESWFGGFAPDFSVTFTFPNPVVEAGIVLTDGRPGGTVTFEAFGIGMVSLGTIVTPFGDGSFFGTTAEDRFFGVKDPTGIIAIKIIGAELGITEVDHVQYGGPVIAPVIDADEDGFDETVDCNDNDDTVFPGATEVFNGVDDDCDSEVDEGISSEDAAATVTDDVQALIDDGTLNKGQGNSLTSKLDNIIKKFENGKEKPACNQLDAFTQHVDSLIADGVLTSAEGQPLIDQANLVKDAFC